jgi:hypothetical protein
LALLEKGAGKVPVPSTGGMIAAAINRSFTSSNHPPKRLLVYKNGNVSCLEVTPSTFGQFRFTSEAVARKASKAWFKSDFTGGGTKVAVAKLTDNKEKNTDLKGILGFMSSRKEELEKKIEFIDPINDVYMNFSGPRKT